MARLELPVITVVYNNHAYGGPHSRVIEKVPGGRMVQSRPVRARLPRQPRHEHGAASPRASASTAEVARSPEELRAALGRARKATADGKPYLIDAQVARVGVAWADKPWTPSVKG